MDSANRLEAFISSPRFATYVTMAAGDRDKAVELYHWTGLVAGGLMTDFRVLEVLLRNRIDGELQSYADDRGAAGPWFDELSWIPEKGNWWTSAAIDSIERAKSDLRSELPSTASLSRGRIVAKLSFGFWVRPTHGRYEESFWLPVLDDAFAVPAPHAADRRELLFRHLTVLNNLRNRVAHHEPICKPWRFTVRRGRDVMYPLGTQYKMLVEVVDWIDPAAGKWLTANSTVPKLLVSPPAKLGAPGP